MGDSPVNCGLTNHSLMGRRAIAIPITVLYKDSGLNAITANNIWTPHFFPMHGAVDSYGHFEPDITTTYQVFTECFPDFDLDKGYLIGKWEKGEKTLWYVGEDVYTWCLEQMSQDTEKIRENAARIKPFLQSRDYVYRNNKFKDINDGERYNLIYRNEIDDSHWSQHEWDVSRFLRNNLEMKTRLAAGIEKFYELYDENEELDNWFREEVVKQYIFMRYLPYIRRTIQPNHSTGLQYEDYVHLRKFDSFVAKRSQALYKENKTQFNLW